jgi:quinoprotein glucose dehydrogenase
LLKKGIKSSDSLERQAAWDSLAEIEHDGADELVAQGLEQYLAGSLSPDVWLNVVEAAESRLDDGSLQALNSFRDGVADDVLEVYRDAAFGGNPAAGRDIFFTKTELSCVRCHRVGETGGEVGPVLTEIGKTKDNRYLLESIVNPDAKIAENFESILLLTEDDEILTGILRKETPDAIELIDANGKIIQVDPELVVSRRKGKSAMPADLVKSMTARELRDLVAYLSSLK